MRRVGVAVVVIMSVSACSGDPAPFDVTGETGYCGAEGTEFSGEPLAGTNLPGRFLEAVVECPDSKLSDDRLSGAVRTEFRCEY